MAWPDGYLTVSINEPNIKLEFSKLWITQYHFTKKILSISSQSCPSYQVRATILLSVFTSKNFKFYQLKEKWICCEMLCTSLLVFIILNRPTLNFFWSLQLTTLNSTAYLKHKNIRVQLNPTQPNKKLRATLPRTQKVQFIKTFQFLTCNL